MIYAQARLKWEYNFLLTTQLEDQRKFFEAKIQQLEDTTKNRLREAKKGLEPHFNHCKPLLEKVVAKVEKSQKQLDQLEKELATLRREKTILENLNKALLEEQKSWRAKIENAEQKKEEKSKQIVELQDQTRDLTLFIEATKTLAKEQVSQEELEGSQITVSPSRHASNSSAAQRERRRRKSKSDR